MDFGSKVPPRGASVHALENGRTYPGPPRFHQSGRTMRWRHVGMYAYAQNLNSRRTKFNAKHELIISFAHPPNRTVLFFKKVLCLFRKSGWKIVLQFFLWLLVVVVNSVPMIRQATRTKLCLL